MSPRAGRLAQAPLLVFLLLASISVSLLLRAWLAPPKGTAFVGTFAYVDDFYNYLSMVEQAQRGVLVFQSKMASPALPPGLINLEWISVGWLSAALGGRPPLAYQLFGLIALALLVWAADHWVTRCGVPQERRLAALLLVFTGGGLGGLLFALDRLPGERAFDLRLGAYPFVEALANPHFVAGTALLATALAAFAAGRPLLGATVGALLGLVRPYDAALLGAIEAASILLLVGPRQWLRSAVPLLALAPALAYNQWLFRASPGFKAWVSPRYGEIVPSAGEWLLLLGPAALFALSGLRGESGQRNAAVQAHLTRLRLWVLIALLMALLRPVVFSLQFVVGIGLPLLVLAAGGLARWRHALETALPLMSSTAVVYAWLCATPNIGTHPPAERLRVTTTLRPACRPGEIVLAPADIGLYVGGLTPCWPFVSHPAAPDFDSRFDAVQRFYDPAASPQARALFLDRACISHVILPAGTPADWLGGPGTFRPRAAPTGGGRAFAFAVWTRDPAPACSGLS